MSAQFLHSPVAVPGERERVLGLAAAAVAPGGRVLVASHAVGPSWAADLAGAFARLPTPAENLAALGLDPEGWVIERDTLITIDVPGPDGQPGFRQDHVLRARRASPELEPGGPQPG